ncbi:aldo/keto reductase [Bacillus sp. 2205SS5-2]|uniref:aldo/keto reductase n=1 Tax=Bacillus sp. 2205SS5-2 TaxID=3109031 RepID=UPI00300621A9
MNNRALGNTGIRVSEIGFGAWQLGNQKDWGQMSDQEAVALVHEALFFGCGFFDTAPNYGLGKSEEFLGKALVGKREQVVISTKFGHHVNNLQNFDEKLIRSSLEGSLHRLQMEYVDVLLLHNPPFECINENSPQFEELERLKDEGKIRAYGASVDSSRDLIQLVNTTKSQVIEVMYNIFHQEPARAFALAKEKEVGLIAKVPLDSGWLSGKYDENSHFEGIRSRWSKEQIERRASLLPKIAHLAGEHTSLVQVALGFILSNPAISTVIPGARNVKQLKENISASNVSMSSKDIKLLEQVWEQELARDPLAW